MVGVGLDLVWRLNELRMCCVLSRRRLRLEYPALYYSTIIYDLIMARKASSLLDPHSYQSLSVRGIFQRKCWLPGMGLTESLGGRYRYFEFISAGKPLVQLAASSLVDEFPPDKQPLVGFLPLASTNPLVAPNKAQPPTSVVLEFRRKKFRPSRTFDSFLLSPLLSKTANLITPKPPIVPGDAAATADRSIGLISVSFPSPFL